MVQIEEFHFFENPSIYLSNFKSNDTKTMDESQSFYPYLSHRPGHEPPSFSLKNDMNAIYSNPVGDAKSLGLIRHIQNVEIEGNIESLGTHPRKSYIPKSFRLHSIINPKCKSKKKEV